MEFELEEVTPQPELSKFAQENTRLQFCYIERKEWQEDGQDLSIIGGDLETTVFQEDHLNFLIKINVKCTARPTDLCPSSKAIVLAFATLRE